MEENLHRTISVTLKKGMEITQIQAILRYIEDDVSLHSLVLLNDKELIFTKEKDKELLFSIGNQIVKNREIW